MAYKNIEDGRTYAREKRRSMTPEQKAARSVRDKARRIANKDEFKVRNSEYYQANKEARLAYTRANAHKYRLKSKLKRYGLTVEAYEELIKMQRRRCAICRRGEAQGRGRWHVDHCHDTGKVRGLLCSNCNVGLGLMQDSADQLRRAASYLDRHPKGIRHPDDMAG